MPCPLGPAIKGDAATRSGIEHSGATVAAPGRTVATQDACARLGRQFIARELDSLGVDRNRITIIYNAPTRRDRPPKPEVAPENPTHVLFLGQITPEKGADRLIEAFKMVAPDFPAAQLTLAGRISERADDAWAIALRDRVNADPALCTRVVFAGEIEDIYPLLERNAFLAVPSICEEAFGLVCGEAKAAARPSVVFPNGGLPEQIRHLEDGFVCRDTSVTALAEGLRYYLSDPDKSRHHGQAALASLKRLGMDMDMDKFANQWRAVYDRSA